MSIMPEPFEPQICREDHNQSSSQIINRIQQSERKERFSKKGVDSKINQKCKKFWQYSHRIVQNIYFQVFITLFTVSSLFMEDVRIITIEKQHDTILDIINIIFIIIFLVQIIMSLSVPGYFCSFFFFLDIISTLSLIMDISMITNILYQNSSNSGLQLSMIIRNSKATRAAARTVRVMKIFRLARIVKIYKSALKARQLKQRKMKLQIQQKLNQIKIKKAKLAQKQQQILISSENSESQNHSKNQLSSMKASLKVKQIKMPQGLKTFRSCKIDRQNQKNKQKQTRKKQFDIIQKEDNSKSEKEIQINDKLMKKQSKISKLLSESSMKKIIIVILLLMLSIPVLDIDNYYQQVSAWDFLADFIVLILQKPQIEVEKINSLIIQSIQNSKNNDDSHQSIILFKTPFQELYSYDSGLFHSQRINDLIISQSDVNISLIKSIRNGSLTLLSEFDPSYNITTITFIFSCKQYNKIDSWFSISKILFICVTIIYLLNVFNESITHMITEPIQKMLQDVKNNGKLNSFEYFQNNSQDSSKKMLVQTQRNNYETTNVHIALNKISKLIAKIFGVRGKQYIYRQIFQRGSVVKNYLNKQNPHKIYCILAYCTIDNYYVISKILKEEAVQLNNEVGEYLHSASFRYGASGLINHQGSFLVVFQCPAIYEQSIRNKQAKLKKKMKQTRHKFERSILNFNNLLKSRDRIGTQRINKNEKNDNPTQDQNKDYFSIFADFSIYALVKTIVKINKQGKFYKYRKDRRLIKQFGDNFSIKLNCVLHSGWIEQGFFGSIFKMDFSYYGKSIQQVKKIACHSKNLPSQIVLSQNIYEHITLGMRRYTRIIDKYIDNQLQIQYNLYSVDLNLQNISPPKNIWDIKHLDISLISLKKILNFEVLKDQQQIKNYKASAFINSKKQLREVMKDVVSEEFRKRYQLAYRKYLHGQLQQSKQLLDQLAIFKKDDPLVMRLYLLIQIASKNQNRFVFNFTSN